MRTCTRYLYRRLPYGAARAPRMFIITVDTQNSSVCQSSTTLSFVSNRATQCVLLAMATPLGRSRGRADKGRGRGRSRGDCASVGVKSQSSPGAGSTSRILDLPAPGLQSSHSGRSVHSESADEQYSDAAEEFTRELSKIDNTVLLQLICVTSLFLSSQQ